LLQCQILAQTRLETGWRHSLSTQHRFIAFLREFSIDLEGIDPADRAADRAVAGEQTFLTRFQRQQLLVYEVIEYRLACFRGVEDLWIDLPHLRPQALLLLTHGLLELLLADLDIADLGHRVPGSRIAHVGIDTEKGERQRDQRQKYLDDFLVVANCVKH